MSEVRNAISPPRMPLQNNGAGAVQGLLEYGEYTEALRTARNDMSLVIDRLSRALETVRQPKDHARLLRESEVARAEAFADREEARCASTVRA